MKKTILIVIAIITMVVLGIFAQGQFNKGNYIGKPYTLISRITYFYPNPNQNYVKDKIEYVFTDGSFRIISKNDKLLQDLIFQNGRGAFGVDHKNRVLRQDKRASPVKVARPPQTARELTSSPQFVGTKQVLGFLAYIHRIKDESTGLPVADLYYIEGIDRPIKLDEYDGKGNISSVEEPIQIIWGEPDQSLKNINYPIVQRGE